MGQFVGIDQQGWRYEIQRQRGSISEDCCDVNREAKRAKSGRDSIRSRHHTLPGSMQTAIC